MLGDIEDIEFEAEDLRRNSAGVALHATSSSKVNQNGSLSSSASPNIHAAISHLTDPALVSIWVKTWGCSHNNSDGEYMAGILSANGYNVLLLDSDKDKAHVWLLNSCTVKGPSEQAFINEIRRAQTAGKVVIVSGCVPQANLSNKEWDGLSIIGVQQIDRVVEVVQESLMGNIVRFTRDKRTNIAVVEEQGTNNNAVGELNDDDDDYVTTTTLKKRKAGGATLDMPKIRKNPFIEIIPINTGCLNQCTYCKTKHARGDLGSYTPEEIVSRIESVVKEGVVEIWLTSEDLGAYGHDIGVKITDLLWKCIAKIEECDANNVVMIRVGMTNPPYILDLVDEMAQVLSHPRVYSFLHVPVQAASNKVLNDMRRLYQIDDFKKVVTVLREKVANMTIATDIICGFPTETDEDFEETLALLREYKFPVLHISQFYPRPGTPAARMKLIGGQEVKRRSREATKIFESYTTYSVPAVDQKPCILTILVTEISADRMHYVGHDKSYRQILVPMNTDIMGKKVVVQTTECGKFYIKAKLVMDPVTGSYDIRSTSAAEDVVEKKKFKTKNLNSNINGGNDSGSDATYETLGKRPMLPKVVRVNRKLVRVDSKSSSAIANPMSDNNNNNYNNNNNNASLSTAVDTAEIENGNGIHDMNKETDEPLFELSLGNNSEAFIMKKRVAFDGAESSTTAASDIDTDNEEIVPTSSFGLPNSLYMTYILILLGPFFIYSLLTSVGWWSEISLFFKVALLCVCAILYCEVIASIRKS